MTELEKRIYKCAMDILPEARERVQNISTQSRYISIPFRCDGCYDQLIFDTKASKFTKIKYSKGKGTCVGHEGMGDFVGYFDETEICEIELNLHNK